MRRVLGGLAALALSFAGIIGTATPAQAVPPQAATAHRYAALGDSYAAGYGLPPKSDAASQLCARSNLAYPELLNGFPKLTNLDFVACSGSTTTDVLTGQLAGLSPSTRTVTLTVGGNDLGFSQLACLQTGCDLTPLIAAAGPSLTKLAAGPAVPGSLSGLLAAIQARAPQARIFVTGYPKLFGTASKLYGTGTACPVPLAARTAVNSLVDSLNTVISGTVAAARTAGANVTYVGVAGAFARHGVCDSRVPFISTVLHPNLLGQATYAAVLTAKGVTR